MLRIPSALHNDLRGGPFDFTQIIRRELDFLCPNVPLQTRQLCGAGIGTITASAPDMGFLLTLVKRKWWTIENRCYDGDYAH
jgi:hypothetical protein